MNFTHWNGNGLGGGIGILLLRNSSHVTINIMNCPFQKNLAPWGGGLCIYLQTQTSSNRVTIARSTLIENSARNGGGGIQVRLGRLERGFNNKIVFQNIILWKNWAKFGGGTSINALFVNHITGPGEILQFNNCTWHQTQDLIVLPLIFHLTNTSSRAKGICLSLSLKMFMFRQIMDMGKIVNIKNVRTFMLLLVFL